MEKNFDILDKVNRRSGMTVPDGFFDDFARRMQEKIDAQPKTETKVLPPSAWQRVRPYVYLAAMFGGIWCMVKMFNLFGVPSTNLSIDENPTLASAIVNEAFVEEFAPIESIDEYSMMQEIYDSGANPEEVFDFVDSQQ